MAMTLDLVETKVGVSRVTEETGREGMPATVPHNNKSTQLIFAPPPCGAIDVAVDFMDEYVEVFGKLAT